jgi:uncharacterized repeat protein (TIGR03806 family)
VGQDLYEEVDVIVKGGNYGWNLREGTHDFRPELAKGGEKLIEPVIDYDHSVGLSVTGGVVYRGRELPELFGAYLYADYETGYVWALRYNGEIMTGNSEITRVKRQITSFGQDEANEVYLTCFDGYIHKFRKTASDGNEKQPPFPRMLSETGFFTSTKTMAPAPGMIPYSVNVPLWSDGAAKERYLALPAGKTVKFSPEGIWEFPEGSVLVKSFFLEEREGDPNSRRRLETRFMVHSERGWDGYTYLWNDEQTDAQLLDTALTKEYRVKTDRGEIVKSWYFPSRADCMMCHTQSAGFVLGLNARQMNRDQKFGSIVDNQLRTMDHIGVFETQDRIDPKRLETYPDWSSSKRRDDLTIAARAYLDVNCAICHCPGGEANNSLDMRFHTPLAETKLLGTPPAKGDLGPEGSKILTAGDPKRSILLTRMKTRREGKMPPMASAVVDEEAVKTIEAWIKTLK